MKMDLKNIELVWFKGTGLTHPCLQASLRIQIRILWIHMFLGLLDPDLDPFVRGTDLDPSIIKQK
jgi:hypothetical protein